MRREQSLQTIASRDHWDVAIIGGGATGMGLAVDAASRGFSVCLLEQHDFGKGTSSRSTKLIHGGVRYLRQGKLPLVFEALRERAILRENAPHLVHDLELVIPVYRRREGWLYRAGLKIYDLLARGSSFGKSCWLNCDDVIARIPTIRTDGLRGGILYHDGQFDDSRLLIDLAFTAEGHGAALVNYAKVIAITHDQPGAVDGLKFIDIETGREHSLCARCVINATGAFCDGVRRLDDSGATSMVAPSQGAHVVLDGSFLPGRTAIMVPRTRDRRVMFAIPWHGHTLLGTTDVLVDQAVVDPIPFETEIDFILGTAGEYLARRPTRSDILSAFAGIRPLVKSADTSSERLSRDHVIHVSRSGLITLTGGKWTTYRNMARECIDRAVKIGKLTPRTCVTRTLKIHGYDEHPEAGRDLAVYGSSARQIQIMIDDDPALGRRYHHDLPICPAQVIWAVQEEMARTLEDVLSRRTRCLPLNARVSMEIAPAVLQDLARALGRDSSWQAAQLTAFLNLARQHVCD